MKLTFQTVPLLKSFLIATLFLPLPAPGGPQPPYSYRSSGSSQAEIMNAQSAERYRQINARRAVEQSQRIEANRQLNQRLASEAVQRANGQTVFPISPQSSYRRPVGPTTYRPQRIVIGEENIVKPAVLPPTPIAKAKERPIAKIADRPITTAKDELTAEAPLPTKTFSRTYPNYSNNPLAGNYALFHLLNETIGPQSSDGPVIENPEIEAVWADSINRDRFSMVKALFDTAAMPEIEAMRSHSAWVGRCIHRSTPNLETGAAIGIRVDNNSTKIVLLLARTAEELMVVRSDAHPTKYDDMNATTVAEITARLKDSHPALSELSQVPMGRRPHIRDSLFFDVAIPSDPGSRVKTGYRLRMAHGPNGELVPVLEGYAPFEEGTAMTGRRVEFLDHIRYCYFTKAYDLHSWSESK